MFFVIEFFLTITSYQFLKIDWIFINYGLFKKDVFYSILLSISATENFNFKNGNSRVIENIFPEKLSHVVYENPIILK